MKKQMEQSNCLPKISVIIPVFNTKEYLPRCLTSVLMNTYRNLEIICIDDGSTDGSAEILDEFARSDARVRIIHKNNEGVSAARNMGLKLATGDFIAFIDSDDWVHRQYFEVLIYCVQKYGADIAICRETNVSTAIEDEAIDVASVQVQGLSLMQAVTNYSAKQRVWGRIYSKESISGHLFCEEIRLVEDAVFNLDVMCNLEKPRLVLVEALMYYYFMRENSAVHTLSASEMEPSVNWYLSHIEDAHTDEVKNIYLFEAFKGALSYRYGVMFEPDRKNAQAVPRRMISNCLCAMKKQKNIPIRKRLQYQVLAMFPFAYRAFRILNDRTMLEWEKKQKKRLRNSRSVGVR